MSIDLLLSELSQLAGPAGVAPDAIDRIVADLDRRIAAQIDEILHHPAFQALERAWRGLWFLVERTDFTENIRIEIVNCSKADLLTDLRASESPARTWLARRVHEDVFHQAGGEPFGAVLADFTIEPTAADVWLLRAAGVAAAMAHCPFLAAASSAFVGLDNSAGFARLGALRAISDVAVPAEWDALRGSDDARFLGLVLPRFRLRAPLRWSEASGLEYVESVTADHEHRAWGNAIYALGTRLVAAFARDRWCPNIIGPADGAVQGLPVLDEHALEGEPFSERVVESLVTERLECTLSEAGFIVLTGVSGGRGAAFFSASSLLKPRFFGQTEEGRAAELNFRLMTQLPYVFIAARIAQYTKVVARELRATEIRRYDNETLRQALERELNDWAGHYVIGREVKAQRERHEILRKVQIQVNSVAHADDWYAFDLRLRPRFKFFGAFYTLRVGGGLRAP